MGRIFGTDGVRGVAGEGFLSPESIARLGAAIGRVLEGGGGAVLAHDGRASAPDILGQLGGGLASRGIHAVSAGLLPTPGLIHLARSGDFACGVMVSASHNPATDNGIKIVGPDGAKLDEATEDAIEEAWEGPGDAAEPADPPEDRALRAAYTDYLLETAGAGLDLSGMKVALDCAHGAASTVGPEVLSALGAEVQVLNAAPDGTNINRDCGSLHPEIAASAGADLGIALDGDADRSLFGDEQGRIVDGDGVIYATALDMIGTGSLRDGRVVLTVMANLALQKDLTRAGAEVETTPVGDKHVAAALRQRGGGIGGEQSGHIIYGPDNGFVGDGLFTALRVLEMITRRGDSLGTLTEGLVPYPQTLLAVQVASRPPLEDLSAVQEAIHSAENDLGTDGRVFVRYSGTEPIARVLVEGPESERVARLAESIAAAIRASVPSP